MPLWICTFATLYKLYNKNDLQFQNGLNLTLDIIFQQWCKVAKYFYMRRLLK